MTSLILLCFFISSLSFSCTFVVCVPAVATMYSVGQVLWVVSLTVTICLSIGSGKYIERYKSCFKGCLFSAVLLEGDAKQIQDGHTGFIRNTAVAPGLSDGGTGVGVARLTFYVTSNIRTVHTVNNLTSYLTNDALAPFRSSPWHCLSTVAPGCDGASKSFQSLWPYVISIPLPFLKRTVWQWIVARVTPIDVY